MLNLITDRTQTDVRRWRELRNKGWSNMTAEERAEWESSLKGAYNYTDMNRVEAAVEYVAERLREIGYTVALNTKSDWDVTDKPTLADLNRYYSNVAQLREVIRVYQTTPITPTTEKKLDYQMANNLEQILVDIDELIGKTREAWYFSGEIYTGEV